MRLPDVYGYDRNKLGDPGVCHADELFIMFHQEGITKSATDMKMAEKLVDLWTKFATKGMPGNGEWQKVVRGTEPKFAILDLKDLRMATEKERKEYLKSIHFATEQIEKRRKNWKKITAKLKLAKRQQR